MYNKSPIEESTTAKIFAKMILSVAGLKVANSASSRRRIIKCTKNRAEPNPRRFRPSYMAPYRRDI